MYLKTGAALALLNLTIGAAAGAFAAHAPTLTYNTATRVRPREASSSSSSSQMTLTPYAGLPDTQDIRRAFLSAKPGLQHAVKMLTSARGNPMDSHSIDWDGDEGINCEGDVAGGAWDCYSWPIWGGEDTPFIEMMLNLTVLIDPDRRYSNEEPIICLESNDSMFGDAHCLWVDGAARHLKGSEIVVLFGFMWDHRCEHCGRVPIRLIEDGKNEAPYDGWLRVDPHIEPNGCKGVCGGDAKPFRPMPGGQAPYLPADPPPKHHRPMRHGGVKEGGSSITNG